MSRRMSICRLGALLGLATIATSLCATAPALAAPAGDEYLPKVPKAAGKQVAVGKDGAGGTILEPAVRGSNQAGDPDSKSLDEATPAAASSGGSGGGALLDPVVLLVIAGVIAATAGMLLRRRQADTGLSLPPRDGAEKAPSERPTPEGRIVNEDDAPEGDSSPDPPPKEDK